MPPWQRQEAITLMLHACVHHVILLAHMQQHARVHVWAKLLLLLQNSWLQGYFLPGLQR